MSLRGNYKIKSFQNDLTDNFVPIWQLFKKYQCMVIELQKYNYILVKRAGSFVHLFNRYLLKTYYEPSMVFSSQDIATSKRNKNLSSHGI